MKQSVEAKTRAQIKADALLVESRASSSKCDAVNEELRTLKLVCHEMELNTEDLERLNEDYEKRHEQLLQEK